MSYLLPHARRVAAPSWVLDRRHLRHLHRCGVAAGHAATRAWRAVTAPACAALRHAVAGRTGRGRPGKRRPSAAPTGCARAVKTGRTRCPRGLSRRRERGPRVHCASGLSAVSAQ
jgi:hypothetical protein